MVLTRPGFVLIVMIVSSALSHLLRSLPSEIDDMTWHLDLEDSLRPVDDPNYPEEDAMRILDKLKRKNLTIYFLNKNEIPKDEKDEAPKYETLCKADRMVVSARTIKNSNDEKLFVLNPKSELVQYYEIEVCNASTTSYDSGAEYHGSCRLVDFVGSGKSAACVQHYMLRKIFVLTETEPRQPTTKMVPIPSVCSCVAKWN